MGIMADYWKKQEGSKKKEEKAKSSGEYQGGIMADYWNRQKSPEYISSQLDAFYSDYNNKYVTGVNSRSGSGDYNGVRKLTDDYSARTQALIRLVEDSSLDDDQKSEVLKGLGDISTGISDNAAWAKDAKRTDAIRRGGIRFMVGGEPVYIPTEAEREKASKSDATDFALQYVKNNGVLPGKTAWLYGTNEGKNTRRSVQYGGYGFDELIDEADKNNVGPDADTELANWLYSYALEKDLGTSGDYDKAIEWSETTKENRLAALEKEFERRMDEFAKQSEAAGIDADRTDARNDIINWYNDSKERIEGEKGNLEARKRLKEKEENLSKWTTDALSDPDYMDYFRPRNDVEDASGVGRGITMYRDGFSGDLSRWDNIDLDYSDKEQLEDALKFAFNSAFDGEDSTHIPTQTETLADKNFSMMTDDEVDTYYYYLNKGGERDTFGLTPAEQYLKDLQPVLDRRWRERQQEGLNDLNGWELAALSLVSVPLNVVSSPYAAASDLGNILAGNDVNANDSFHKGSNLASDIRSATSGKIDNVWLSNLYQAVMSGLDSAFGAAFYGGSGYTVAMGAGAFSQKAAELQGRGASNSQMLVGAIAAGVIEWLTEKASYDKITELISANSSGLAQYFTRVLPFASLNEGIEEVNSELLNSFVESVNMGIDSIDENAVREYMVKYGLSMEEARDRVAKENIENIWWAWFDGAISGGLFSGSEMLASASGQTVQSKNNAALRIGKQTLSSGSLDDIVGIAGESGNKKLVKLAEDVVRQRAKNTDSVSEKYVRKVGKLTSATFNQTVNGIGGAATQARNEELSALITEQTGEKASGRQIETVRKVLNGEELTRSEQKTADKLNVSAIEENYKKNKASISSRISKAVDTAESKYNIMRANYEASAADVSDTGETVRKSNKQTINIARIESIKDGKITFKLTDGSTISSKDVLYASTKESLLYSALASIDVDVDTANLAASAYKMSRSNNAINPYNYALGIEEGYNYGLISDTAFKNANFTTGGFFSALDEDTRSAVYALGQKVRKADTEARYKRIERAKVKTAQKESTNMGRASVDTSAVSEGTMKAVRSGKGFAKQKASIKVLEKLQKDGVIRNNIIFFESVADKNGGRTVLNSVGILSEGDKAPNGYYDARTGDIYIDINAGNNGEGTILYTAAHELTHFLRQWSNTKYNALADMLLTEFGKKDISVDLLVRNQQEMAKEDGRSLSYDEAFEELVADAMQEMFTSNDLALRLEAIKNSDRSTWQKIKDFITELQKSIKELYKGFASDSTEAGLVREMGDAVDKIADAFAEGLSEAAAAYTSETQSVTDIKYNLKNTRNMPWETQINGYLNKSGEIKSSDTLSLNGFSSTLFKNSLPNVVPLSIITKAQDGRNADHRINDKTLINIEKDIGEWNFAVADKKRNSIAYFYETQTEPRPVCVSFEKDTLFDGDRVNKATSIHLQTNTKAYLESLSETSVIYIKNEDSSVPGTSINNYSGLNTKAKLVVLDNNGLTTQSQANLSQTGVELDTKTDSANPELFSARTWNESDYVKNRNAAAEELKNALGLSLKKAKDYIDSVNSISRMIVQDKMRLDYTETGLSPFISNAEYGGSFDYTTLCKKRRLLTGTFSAIQNALKNTALTAAEILEIRKMMDDAGLEVSCGKCYVEGSRAQMGVFARKFIDLYEKYNPGAWIPNMADVNTPDGVERMRVEHPEAYEQYEYFWNHYGTLKKGDPNLFASQQKPKLYQMRSAYDGEILKYFKADSKIEEKNRNGGIRMQSFSDFEIVHLIDAMQTIMDMSRVGLNGQAYTKVPEFALALGATGLKINLSIDAWGVDENGKLIFNNKEGMPFETAMKIREKYSENVGTICCVYDDAQLIAALADDRIDFIIPFHRSQWKKAQYKAMGLPATTKDYTYQQNEKWINPQEHYHIGKGRYEGKHILDKCKNYMPNEYWDFNKSGKENAEAYLEMCARDGKRPKFYKFLTNNGDGSYSLKADGSTDGYWKLLIDFKMYDNEGKGSPQLPVRPDFNMDEATKMLNEYKGGHESFPVAQGIVDEFVKKYKKNHPGRNKAETKDSLGKSLTKEQQNYFKGSKVRDEEGRLLVVYHGTPNGGFTVFNPSKSYIADEPSVASWFSTNREMIDRHYNVNNTMFPSSKKQMYSVYLNIENPLVIDANGDNWNSIKVPDDIAEAVDDWYDSYTSEGWVLNSRLTTEQLAKYAESNGCDGVIIKNVRDGSIDEELSDVYAVFDSNQIKDVGNKTPTKDPDIRYSGRASMTNERIDELIKDSSAGSRADYAQKWIATISPTDFLNMTLDEKNQNREVFDNMPGDYGDTVNTRDYLGDLKSSRQTPYLNINIVTGEVIGHEGRHRMRALEKQGITSTQIAVSFYDSDGRMIKELNGYGNPLDTISSLKIFNQRGTGQSTTLSDIMPLNNVNRNNVIKRYGNEKSDIKYSIRDIVGANGKNYGKGVYLDSTLITNLTDTERKQMVKEYVKELGGQSFTAVDKNGVAHDVYIAETGRKYVNQSGKRISATEDLARKNRKNKTKQEAIALIDELVATANFDTNEPAHHTHGWLDDNGKNDWDLWKTYIQDKEGNIWEANLRVSNATDGKKYLYDIDPIVLKEKGQLGNSSTSLSVGTISQDNSDSQEKKSARSSAPTNRALLAGALETTITSEAEQKRLDEYRASIEDLDNWQNELADVNARLRELMFTPGKKGEDIGSQVSSARRQMEIKELTEQANKLKNRITTMDKKLLRLESTTVLKNVLDREKAAAAKKQAEKDRQRMTEYRERGSRMEYKARIGKISESLYDMLQNANENKFIPANLIESVVGVYNAIDTTGQKEGTKTKEKRAKRIASLSDLQAAYSSLKNNEDFDYASEYDEELSKLIGALNESLNGKALYELNYQQMHDVYDIVHDIYATLRYAKNQIGTEKAVTNYETGLNIRKNMSTVIRNRFGANKFSNFVQRWTENPMRAVREMSGFMEDSELTRLFDDLNKGRRRADTFIMTENKKLDALRSSKADRKAYADAVEEARDFGIEDINGNPVLLTKMQAMQIILTAEREAANENRKHLQANTQIIPVDNKQAKALEADVKKAVKNGDAAALETYMQGSDYVQHMNPIDSETIQKLRDGLNEWDRRFMETAKEIFRKDCPEAINETTMQTKHRPVATEKNYITYVLAGDYIQRDSENVAFNASIDNAGMLKSVVPNAGQPLIIEGLNVTLNRQINNVAKVYGLSVPVRNWNKAFNVKFTGRDGKGTVKTAISAAWGEAGKNLLDQAVADVQTNRATDYSKLESIVRSGFVVSALANNISVAIKQAASYDAAGAYLSQAALAKGLADYWTKIRNGVKAQDVYDEIDAHTSQHWIRRQGLSLQELGDLKLTNGWVNVLNNKLGKLSPMNWIQAIDVGTTAALWYACKSEVKSQIKGTDVKMGSDEYWSKVTDLYNTVIEETQPMYDSLHRAEATKNRFTRSFITFATQPLQNAGILRESRENILAARKIYGKDSAQVKAAELKYRRSVVSQIKSAAVFTGMTMLANFLLHKVNPWRDDETGEVTDESVVENLIYKFMTTFGSVEAPVAGNWLVSMYEAISGKGRYDALSEPVIDKINATITNFENLVSSFDGEPEKLLSNAEKMFFDVLSYFGVPLQNAKNIATGIRYNVEDAVNDTWWDSGYEYTSAQNKERVYNAIVDGDSDKVSRVVSSYSDDTEKAYKMVATSIMDHFKAGDFTAEEAVRHLVRYADMSEDKAQKKVSSAQVKMISDRYEASEIDEDEAKKELVDIGMDEKDASWKVDGWDYAEENGDLEGHTKANNLFSAYLSGDSKKIKEAKGYYKSDDAAITALTGEIGDRYRVGTLNKTATEKYLKNWCKKDSEDIFWSLDRWDYMKQHKDSDDGYSKYIRFDKAVESGQGRTVTVEFYKNHGFKASTLKSAVTSRFKDKYIEAGRPYAMREKLLDMYQAIAYVYGETDFNRYKRGANIDKWTND